MEKLDRLIAALQGLDLDGMARSVLELNRDAAILPMVEEQLDLGRAADGKSLRPLYSEDSYFRTRGQMEWYRNWKRSLPTDNPERPFDAPNLYINGKFWSELTVDFGADSMRICAGTPYAAGIVRKYREESFGLDDAHFAKLRDEMVRPYIIKRIKERCGIR